jgi:hypothetical protein
MNEIFTAVRGSKATHFRYQQNEKLPIHLNQSENA